jgi:hypothetical protein
VKRLLLPLLLLTTGCGLSAETAAPGCRGGERLGVVAQSVPTAAYVPCVEPLPAGWRVTDVDVQRGSSRLALLSDRSGGRPVEVLFEERCDATGASPTPPRADGVRSSLALESVSPTYAGTLYDEFPGGCVQYRFAFPRGVHIPLMEDLAVAVDLLPRRELRLQLREQLGVELDP